MHQDPNCIFCKMISGEMQVPKVYEDGICICIKDIRPQAKVHLLVIPKNHVASLEASLGDAPSLPANELGQLMKTVAEIAKKEGLMPGGFRAVINTGGDGGQTVFHLHVHVLGGEPLAGRFGG